MPLSMTGEEYTWAEYFRNPELAARVGPWWVNVGEATRVARIRRGKYVRIPREWMGKKTDKNTRMKRPSKMTRKKRKSEPRSFKRYKGNTHAHREGQAPKIEDWT